MNRRAPQGVQFSVSVTTMGWNFANLLSVIVKDGFSNPVPGVAVTFTARPGSGTATGNFSGQSTAQISTGSNGVATEPTFTAHTKAGGPYMVAASSVGLTASTSG